MQEMLDRLVIEHCQRDDTLVFRIVDAEGQFHVLGPLPDQSWSKLVVQDGTAVWSSFNTAVTSCEAALEDALGQQQP